MSRKPQKPQKPMSLAEACEIMNLHERGLTPRQIAKALHAPEASVTAIVLTNLAMMTIWKNEDPIAFQEWRNRFETQETH